MKHLIQLFLYARPYWKYLGVATASILGVTALNLVAPMILRELYAIIREGLNANSFSRINQLALGLSAIYLVRSFFQYFARHWNHIAAWRLVRDVRARVYNHLQRLSLSYYQDRQTGDLMSRTVNDTQNFEVLIAHAIPDMLTNILMLVGVAGMLFYLNAKLALFTLLPIPILIYRVITYAKKVRPAFRAMQEKIGELNASLQDNYSGMKEIQAFTQEKRESAHIRTRASDHASATIRAVRLMAMYHPSIELLSSVGTVIIVWIGGKLAVDGALLPEDILAFLLYLGMFYQPVQTLARVNEDAQNALASAERVFAVLEEEPDVKEAPNARAVPITAGNVTFENVSFHYVAGQPVLQGIDLTVNAGETIAIVGPTGVGKTTLVSLIPRFFDPTNGRILIDGEDSRDITLQSLRSQVSLVLQDVFLFNGSVMDNILYGKPDATRTQVVAAAKAACAHEFIERLPNGYDTQIGERGVKLSGGQKQRLSIARALLRNSPILILDEATSSVDTHTERLIQEALHNVTVGRTTFIIAHRLSTVKRADRIIVLDQGSIAEMGTHEELMKIGGIYNKLCSVQFAEDVLPEALP